MNFTDLRTCYQVRSGYRTVELAEGDGPLTTQEIYFWVLDFVPLMVAVMAYIAFWPGRFINTPVMSEKGFPLESQPNLPGKYNESTQNITLYAKGGLGSETSLPYQPDKERMAA